MLKCFSYGADDYLITKQYSKNELISRSRRLLGDMTHPVVDIRNYGSIYLNILKREIYYDGRIVKLTLKELHIMKYLISRNGYCTKKELNTYLLNHRKEIRNQDKNLYMTIFRLEQKFKASTNKRIIFADHGKGYYIKI